MELKDTKAERMGCVTNLEEQGHVPEVTVNTHCSYSFRKEISFSNHRQMPDNTAFNLKPTPNRRERNGQRRLNICYKYRDVGYCPFGSRCKFDHIDQSSFNQYSPHNESKSEHYLVK